MTHDFAISNHLAGPLPVFPNGAVVEKYLRSFGNKIDTWRCSLAGFLGSARGRSGWKRIPQEKFAIARTRSPARETRALPNHESPLH